ncbi:MAG TPA: VWA domain-containing protein [Roseiflexaceae bacterium]|nr:VWA domain-containing protein [Roseiflexaceae bacterium]
MRDNDRRNEAPVPGERVRRLVGWHGYDWMKAAVALVLAALLLYGNAAGVGDRPPATATPTSGMAVAEVTQAAPSPAATESTSAAPATMPTSSGNNLPPSTPTAPADGTAAPGPTTEVATDATDMPTAVPSTPEATATLTSTATTAGQQPADVIVVVDVSGSMAANNKIAGVRTALASFADMLAPSNRIELITFSDIPTVTLSMEPLSEARASVKQIAKGLTPGGATTLYDTTLLAFKEMQAKGDPAHNRVIIVLTDGRDERLNASDESIPGSRATLDETLASIARGGQSGIRLFTIGYGTNADNDVLRRMAAAANGRHFIAGPATIQEVYQTIAQSL